MSGVGSHKKDWSYEVLRALEAWDGELSKVEIVLLVSEKNHAYIMGILDALEYCGMVRFREDGNRCMVSLTEKGRMS